MGQHAKLDLGIVCVQKYKARLRHKDLADQPSKLHTHRNILKIRFRTADTSRRCNGLIKLAVDSLVIRPDITGQPICISGFQFRQLAVFKNLPHNRIIGTQLFKNIGRRRITRLRLLRKRQSQLLK